MSLLDGVAIATAILGLCGFAFGLIQYSSAQRWRKSEFASRLLDTFDRDAEIQLACLFLDWHARRLPVPAKYLPVTSESTFIHTAALMVEAMLPGGMDFPFPREIYRDVFTRFFDFFAQLNHYVRIGLVNAKDVALLDYWLDEVMKPRFVVPENQGIFIEFMRAFDYEGIMDLHQSLKAAGDKKSPHPGTQP